MSHVIGLVKGHFGQKDIALIVLTCGSGVWHHGCPHHGEPFREEWQGFKYVPVWWNKKM